MRQDCGFDRRGIGPGSLDDIEQGELGLGGLGGLAPWRGPWLRGCLGVVVVGEVG